MIIPKQIHITGISEIYYGVIMYQKTTSGYDCLEIEIPTGKT